MVAHLPRQGHCVTARTASGCQADHHGLYIGRPCLIHAPRANLASKTLIELRRAAIYSLRPHLDSKAKCLVIQMQSSYDRMSASFLCAVIRD